MRRLLLFLAIAFALIFVPSYGTVTGDTATVSVKAHGFPITTTAISYPIQPYTPQQTRSSSLHRRVPIEVSNPTLYSYSGALMVNVSFPAGRAPYVGDPSDPSTYYLELRDSEGNIVTYQIDYDLTVMYDAHHAKSVTIRFTCTLGALEIKTFYLYYDIEPVSRTPPSFDVTRTVSSEEYGYSITDGSITYELRTKPIIISPTVYVLNPTLQKVSGGAYYVSLGSYPDYELIRSGILRTVFYFYNYTYYSDYGIYIPVVPTEMLSVINPNYASNGRPYYGGAQDQFFSGAHGGFVARRFLAPTSSVISYSDYGRAFVGALYDPQRTPSLDGTYPTDPTTSPFGNDPDYRNAVGRNASFIRVENNGTYYSYMMLSNRVTYQNTISGRLYAYYSPMHAIDNIQEHFTTYVEFMFYAPRTAAYTLSFGSDDNLRVWIDGKLSIDARTLHGITRYSASYSRKAGTRHLIQIEFVEGPGRYDLHMKFKVTDANDPDNIYVDEQYTRLDSFAVPYSRASAPNLDVAAKNVRVGPVFAKITFKDAPVVPMRGVLPNVLDSDFDRYDIAYGNLTVSYYFLPNGDVYVRDAFKPKDSLADDIALMPYRKFSDNYVEPALTGAAAGNIAILSRDSFMSSNVTHVLYTADSYASVVKIEYKVGISVALVSGSGSYREEYVSIASLTDSSSSYPGDPSPNRDKYKQEAVGISYSGRIDSEVSRDFLLHVYIPGLTDDKGLEEMLNVWEHVGASARLPETLNGLHVTVVDVDNNTVPNAVVNVYYLGVSGTNETRIFVGRNVTDSSGEAAIHSAIFTGNYSVEITYNTTIGPVKNSYVVFMNYTDVVNGLSVVLKSDIAKLKIYLTYANGTVINGTFSGISATIEVDYENDTVFSASGFYGVTDYLPINDTYNITATINLYDVYNVTSSLNRKPSEGGSSVHVLMDVMPYTIFVAHYDATRDVKTPYMTPRIYVTLPNDNSISFVGTNGYVNIPMIPTGVNVTITSTINHYIRGYITVSKTVVPSENETYTELLFRFRDVTVRVLDVDGKPVASAIVIANGHTLYTNSTGYITLEAPDSNIYGPIGLTVKYIEYSYLIPVESVNSMYVSVTSTLFTTLLLPMKDFTLNVTDVSGNVLDDLYRVVLYSKEGVLFDGYVSGVVTFKHLNADPSFGLQVNITYKTFGYEVFVHELCPYLTYLRDMHVSLPIAHLTVYVYYNYEPDGTTKPIEGVIVNVRSEHVSASAVTDAEGAAEFRYLPLSLLVGDYNVSVNVNVNGVEAFESKIVTVDAPKSVYLYVVLHDITVNVVKPSGEAAIAKVKVYLDNVAFSEGLVNGTETFLGLPLKYVSNATFELLYKTFYGYTVVKSFEYSGLQLETMKTTHNATLVVPVGNVHVIIETNLNVKVSVYVGNVSVGLYGNNVTFEEIPYGNRTAEYTVYTAIAPVTFEGEISVDSAYEEIYFKPVLTTINIITEKPSGPVEAKVTLTLNVEGATGRLDITVPGNVTLTEMPMGEYSFIASHKTPYGLIVYETGEFVANSSDTTVEILFRLSKVNFILTYHGAESTVPGKVFLTVSGLTISAYGNNVTFEEIPYGEVEVTVEYAKIAVLTYRTSVYVNASEVSYVIELPLVDLTVELKNKEGTYVSGILALEISGENVSEGSLVKNVVGTIRLDAVPAGIYEFNVSYTTPFGIPVYAHETMEINASKTITVTVPSGKFKVIATGENGRPVPIANVKIEFIEYASVYEGALANGSFVLSDFPYGVKIRVIVNGTFHGFYVWAEKDVVSSEKPVEITMPLTDLSFKILDEDTNGPAAGAAVKLYFNASGNLILVASGVTDENGTITFERIPTEEFMSSVYGTGKYVIEVDYKGGTFYIPIEEASKGEVTVNPPVPRTHIVIVILTIALAVASISAYYYRKHVLGPYHRLKKAISKGTEDIDLDRLPTREEEAIELYKQMLEE